MRQINLEKLAAQLDELLECAQDEAVLVMRNGKPSALILGIEHQRNYDVEDWSYMTDPEFWRMIRERRRETELVSLDDVKTRLAADEQKEQRAVRAKSA